MNTTEHAHGPRSRARQAALWLPGLLVAIGAAVATAHGLYEVARAAEVPSIIAGLYPLITDGLALVAYAATARLTGSGRRYAWTVVVLAAGLSGLAQASYLAHGVTTASTVLRFGIGAWPALAAAIVAHLLFLIATANRTTPEQTPADTATAAEPTPGPEPERTLPAAVQRPAVQPATVQPEVVQPRGVQPSPVQPAVQATGTPGVQPAASRAAAEPPIERSGVQRPERAAVAAGSSNGTSPGERARAAARRHAARHGGLPTVTALMSLADVSRGTAGTALKELRETPAPLHIVTDTDQARTQP